MTKLFGTLTGLTWASTGGLSCSKCGKRFCKGQKIAFMGKGWHQKHYCLGGCKDGKF